MFNIPYAAIYYTEFSVMKFIFSPGGDWTLESDNLPATAGLMSHKVTGLKPSKTYEFEVTASNDIGDGRPSLPTTPQKIPAECKWKYCYEFYRSGSRNYSPTESKRRMLFSHKPPTTVDNSCIRVLGFLQSKWFSVAKSAKLLKSATERRDPKKHLSPSVAICDRKHPN